jgi:hypothetical protein
MGKRKPEGKRTRRDRHCSAKLLRWSESEAGKRRIDGVAEQRRDGARERRRGRAGGLGVPFIGRGREKKRWQRIGRGEARRPAVKAMMLAAVTGGRRKGERWGSKGGSSRALKAQ